MTLNPRICQLSAIAVAIGLAGSQASADTAYFRFRASLSSTTPVPPADDVRLQQFAYVGERGTKFSTDDPMISVPGPVAWSLAPESLPLPPGLGIASGNGRIAGTPTLVGNFPGIVIVGMNGARSARSAPISVAITEPAAPAPVPASTVYPIEVVVDGNALDAARTTMVLRGTFSTARIPLSKEVVAKYAEPVELDSIRFYFADTWVLDVADVSVSSDGGATWTAPIPSAQTTSGNMRWIQTAPVVGTWVRIRPRNAFTLKGLEIGTGRDFPPFQ